jgi:hypothetical protein
MAHLWKLAWNMNATEEAKKVFCTKTFSVPSESPIEQLLRPSQEALADPLPQSRRTVSQKFVDLRQHSQYPEAAPVSGLLPNGLDEFVVLTAYEKLYDRATTLSERYAKFKPGGSQGQLPPRHNMILSGVPGIGKENL